MGPTTMQLHLQHYLYRVAIYVPHRRLAQSGLRNTLYWFHHSVQLPDHVRWPVFVSQQCTIFYAIHLHAISGKRASGL